jgi:hypothetical protein
MDAANLTVTAHYLVRARQRGYRLTDLAFIETLGSSRGDGIFLREKDLAPELKRLSASLQRMRKPVKARYGRSEIDTQRREIVREIERLERLSGAYIPIEDGHALSIYRPSKRRLKRILRDRSRGQGQYRGHR